MERLELNTLEELSQTAKKFLAQTKGKKKFAFFGDLGAGKTTFIKALCNELDVIDIVSSPTFSLINEYLTESGEKIFHMDFYRIDNINEAQDIGIEDYFLSRNYCFIEWPEKIENLLPEDFIYVKIEEKQEGKRTLQFE
ncbi:MAG: tRNA (adenosine(37)-N6)-threonylcarbamoyltransferase complex ATPase subunit type 1 TsaE [Bacteroidales bacterium]